MESDKLLPFTNNTPVVRTDFEDDRRWKAVCDLIRQPVHDAGQDFLAYVDFVDDPIFRDCTPGQLLAMLPPNYSHSFLFIVDRTALQSTHLPILVMDLRTEPGRTFRAIPSQIQGIQNNLSIANMDFSEFADSIDEDGVFRGFKEP